METQYAIPTESAVPPAGVPSAAPVLGHLRPMAMRGTPRMPGNRQRLAAAFRALGVTVVEPAAFGRTKDFYRTGGGDWTRGLSR